MSISSPGKKFYSHLNTAKALIAGYDGHQPFSAYSRTFFSANKKYGSKDRKSISEMCYAFFRMGKCLNDLETAERIVAALFLCATGPSDTLAVLAPEWNAALEAGGAPAARIAVIQQRYPSFALPEIFPFSEPLSAGIDREQFFLSHLRQPDLFIRLRPAGHQRTLNALRALQCLFEFIPPYTVRLANSFPLSSLNAVADKDFVVQDYSSQLTARFLRDFRELPHSEGPAGTELVRLKVWDCCAASGGKSIMAVDTLGAIDLTVTDVRDSILHQLNKRFAVAGITNYHSSVVDLARTGRQAVSKPGEFDLIIADAPCSGSGTWSRNPERLRFFTTPEIAKYAERQKKIVSAVANALKKGGRLLYITCSVFEAENEQIAAYIQAELGLTLMEMQLIPGYDQKADSLFGALFVK